MTWNLNDKTILITGAARGIGAATAREMARRGARVVLADLDAEALAATAAEIFPVPLAIELDVTDRGACEAAVQRAQAEHGRLDAVWANAGIASFGPLGLSSAEAWTRTIAVNLVGAFNTVRAALPPVIEARGYVAVTASMASFAHAPSMSAYSASKAGVEAMCDSLRIEVAHHGVDVASIHPSWIDTDMVREGDEQLRAFHVLRGALSPPFHKTYPVERAVKDIVRGFEARKRRVCSPWFVQLGHALRPLLSTQLAERQLRAAAPEMERLFRQEAAEQGADQASVSRRVATQLGAGERVTR